MNKYHIQTFITFGFVISLFYKILWFILKSQKERAETGYNTEGCGKIHSRKIHGGNIVAWARPRRGKSKAERSEQRDLEIPKAEVPLEWTHKKVHWPQVISSGIKETGNDPSENLHTTMGRWNCQGNRVNMEKRGNNEMEVHWDQQCGKHQTRLGQ